MAKVKITNYVKALTQLLEIGDEKEQQLNFVGYLKLLKKNKQLKQIDEILDLYQKELNLRSNTLQAHVYYDQQPPSDINQKLIIQFLATKFKIKNIELILTQKPIGQGYILEVNDHLFDFTLEQQLTNFKHQLLEA